MSDIKIRVPTPKFSKKNLLRLAAGISIIALLAVAFMVLYKPPVTTWNFKGTEIAFRADLREAAKIPVYPGDTQVYLDVMNPFVKNVTIVFKDAGEDGNPLYIVQEIELVTKMSLGYMFVVGTVIENGTIVSSSTNPGFDAMAVEGYANLPGKIQNPIIALVHPKFANETAVRNEYHVTYISGKTKDELDLAMTRFLMISMGIDPKDLG